MNHGELLRKKQLQVDILYVLKGLAFLSDFYDAINRAYRDALLRVIMTDTFYTGIGVDYVDRIAFAD